MRTVIIAVVLATVLGAGRTEAQKGPPPNREAALDAAIAATITRFNENEDALRSAPKVQRVGPADEPAMLRATYRKADGPYQVLGNAGGDPTVVTVRVRAQEFEKRATNVNAGDLEKDFAAAAWKATPRGYLLDFRLHWTGSAWEQQGPPAEHPTLGVVGQP